MYTYVNNGQKKSLNFFHYLKSFELKEGTEVKPIESIIDGGFNLKDVVNVIKNSDYTVWTSKNPLTEEGHKTLVFARTGGQIDIYLYGKGSVSAKPLIKTRVDFEEIESELLSQKAADFIVYLLDTYFGLEWSDFVEDYSVDTEDNCKDFLSEQRVVGIDFTDEGEYINTANFSYSVGTLVATYEDGKQSSPSQNVTTSNKESNKMTAKTAATALIAKNKSAAITTAKITVGKAAMKQVTKLVSPKLPMMVRGYADTPVGRLLIANIFSFAVANYMANNKKAAIVADAMLEGAMMETMSSLNLEEMLEDLLDKVNISKLESLDAE